jgi:hypothetical protein
MKINRYFGGTCPLHLQDRKLSQETNQHEALSKRRLTFNGLHGVISKKIEIFTFTFAICDERGCGHGSALAATQVA